MDITTSSSYNPLLSSPLLPLLLASLRTQKNTPKEATSFKDKYDYIIVGAGSAGSVVASRLSEEACVSVLLLEAGHGAYELSDVPAISRSTFLTDIDWHYKTVPQKYTGEALIDKKIPMASGKGLGGSSLINAMAYVRGNKQSYDDWAAQGAEGWSYKDVLPYFLKAEDNQNKAADDFHATGGPLTVETPEYVSEVRVAVEEAAESLGYQIVDSNGARQTGFDQYQSTLRNSQRCSTAKAYLVPAENRTNLDIVGGAYVKRILIKGNKAYGVEFDHNSMTHEVMATREVIVSAGTVKTPQILMLSGIGPTEHLEKFNISIVADLPVGNNLQDHYVGVQLFTIDTEPVYNKIQSNQSIEQYINNRTGPLALPQNIDILAFLNESSENPTEDSPDYELQFCQMWKDVFKYQVGFTKLAYDTVVKPYENDSILLCLSAALNPKSRGTIRLNSSDPFDTPLIDPNYFSDPSDIDVVVSGLKACQTIGQSRAMSQIGTRMFESTYPNCLPYKDDKDKYLACAVRNTMATLNQIVGTCKMGGPNDKSTVVDPQLRVKGIEGLRVVDASVMPTVTTGNTNAPVIMIAEKASDLIKQTIQCAN